MPLAGADFIGPEFDAKLISPDIPGIEKNVAIRVRVAYEALVVVEKSDAATPLAGVCHETDRKKRGYSCRRLCHVCWCFACGE